jgi:hypothetical protein
MARMPQPPLEAPDPALARWERGTRRWTRIGAVMLLASVLLPLLWITSGSDSYRDSPASLHVHWFWEDAERALDYGNAPVLHPDPLPCLVLWLALAGFVWRVGARHGLARRGMWWTAATVLVVAIGSPERSSAATCGGSIPWPLEWPQLYLVSAALGLLLLRTGTHVPAGRGICLFGGLYALGGIVVGLLDPRRLNFWVHCWDDRLANVLDLAGLLLAVVVCSLLLRVGASRIRRPGVEKAAALLFLVSLLAAQAEDYSKWGTNTSPDAEWTWQLVVSSVYMHVRLWLRPYGSLVILVTGLFAWIAGATRSPRPDPPATMGASP